MKDEIRKAIGAHGLWKTRLKDAIQTGKSEFTVEGVGKDNNCEFGQWLYGTAKADTRYAKRFETVRRLHADFHKEVARILELALKGGKDSALAALGDNTPFHKLSAELTMEMMSWAKEVS
jgi:methyl-accepting chemotaxis protein